MAVITKKTAFVGVVLVAGLAALWKFVWQPMEEEKNVVKTPAPTSSMQPVVGKGTPMTDQSSVSATPPAGQKNLTVQTHYSNPGGGDDVAFMLMVDGNGVITQAVTEVLAHNDISKMRQNAFATELPKVIVGKKLSDLSSVDRVGGSSLTTKAFNEALPQLKAQL
jgi:hypothetical protein